MLTISTQHFIRNTLITAAVLEAFLQEDLGTIKTIYVGISVDKEVTAGFSPHGLFYRSDWKQAVLTAGGGGGRRRREETGEMTQMRERRAKTGEVAQLGFGFVLDISLQEVRQNSFGWFSL